MSEVSYLQKDDTVGTGASSYKGISDEKVKESLRNSMIVHGLYCIPINVEKQTNIERWQEPDQYSKVPGAMKTKQQIFTDMVWTFRVYHISGAYIEGTSVGHGIDSQDKAPGKAMTYAMKYFLLNLFMIPTGLDPDKIHSNQIEVPKTETVKTPKPHTPLEKSKPQFPSEAEVLKNLYKDTGIISPEIYKGVIENWTQNGAALLYGKYIYTVTPNGKNYFELTDNQYTKIKNLVKFKHGEEK